MTRSGYHVPGHTRLLFDDTPMRRGYGRTRHRKRDGVPVLVWREARGYFSCVMDGRVQGAPAGPEPSEGAALAAVGGL